MGVPPFEDDDVRGHGGCGYGRHDNGTHQASFVDEDAGVCGQGGSERCAIAIPMQIW